MIRRRDSFKEDPQAFGYRLPTEAEWEFACRAGSEQDWWFGNDPQVLDAHEWTIRNSNGHPHPVGELLPNPFGLYDMHGNVWEWTQNAKGSDVDYYDRFMSTGLLPGLQIDPGHGIYYTLNSSDYVHTRGGAYDVPLEASRAGWRGYSPRTRTDGHISFRVVLPADPATVARIVAGSQ